MKTLFISYNSALEPLIQSQGIPYLKGLSGNGIECTLLSFEKPRMQGKDWKEKKNRLKMELKNSGIDWHILKYHKKPTVPATAFDICQGIIRGLSIILKKKIDIIHARAAVPAVMAYILAKITKKKLICDIRGLMAEEYVDGGMWKENSLLYRITRSCERRIYSSANGLVVLSENIKDFFITSSYLLTQRAIKQRNISVIPCCVDTAKFNKEGNPDRKLSEQLNLDNKFVFLYSGSLGTWYLFNEMIDFFMTAKKAIHNAHFLILTAMRKKSLQNALALKKITCQEITILNTEFENIQNYIRLADVGVFFIKPAFSKKSSCPIKFAEYLASGLPVIINKGVGDTDKIVENSQIGVVLKAFTEDEYSSATAKILELLKNKERLSEQCVLIANKLFSLEIGISRYSGLYHRVFSS